MNLIDSVISYFSPEQAARRLYYKNAITMMESGYIAGSSSHQSMQLFNPLSRSADGDALPDLCKIRSRSRDLVRNSAIGRGVIKTIISGVLGEGLRLIPTLNSSLLGIEREDVTKLENKIETEFSLWADEVFCDTERMLNFYGLQKLALRSYLENGDVFALLTRRDMVAPYSFVINLIEADLCVTPMGYSSYKNIIGGVRKDAYGAPVSYFFIDKGTESELEVLNSFSASRYCSGQFKEISAYSRDNRRQILHMIDKERVGQTRGIPVIAPVMKYIKQIDRYSEAELAAAVIAGAFTVFIHDEDMDEAPPTPYAEPGENKGKDDVALAPGAIVQLGSGKKIETANPARPNSQYEPFIVTNIKQIGMGLQIPYEVLFKHFASSYSASQGALLEASKFFLNERAEFIRQFCFPVYEEFFTEAVQLGRIEAPGFFDDPIKRKAYLSAQWVGPAKGMIDELKEVKASDAKVRAGFSTKKREAMKFGGLNIDQIMEQRAYELERERQLKIPIEGEQIIIGKDEETDEEEKE